MYYLELSHIVIRGYRFLVLLWGQNITWVLSYLRVSTFYKSMMRCPNRKLLLKIEVFFKKMNLENDFWLFSIIFLCFMFLSSFMALKLPTKVHFLQFSAVFSKKPKSVKAIYILHLEVLTTLFQKMMWFIEIWGTVHEVLETNISKKLLTYQKFNKITWLQTLISPKM